MPTNHFLFVFIYDELGEVFRDVGSHFQKIKIEIPILLRENRRETQRPLLAWRQNIYGVLLNQRLEFPFSQT